MARIFAIVIMVVFWQFFDGAVNAHAVTAFSRALNLKCDACHKAKIPELNEFGIGFYQNGFSLLTKHDVQTAKVKINVPGPGQAPRMLTETGTAEPKDDAPPASPVSGGEKVAVEETEPAALESTPKEPPPSTLVYRSRGRDGSFLFTDNPYRRDSSEAPAVQAKSPRRLAAGKLKQPSLSRDAGRRKAVTPVAKVEHFRSYEECMERRLLDAPQPGSAQEAMNLFAGAEHKCSVYPVEKRRNDLR